MKLVCILYCQYAHADIIQQCQIILCCAITAVFCGPVPAIQPTGGPIPILKFDYGGVNPDGSYQWNYETGNGISAQQRGQVKTGANPKETELEVSGSYEHTKEDGTKVLVTYIANKDGYQPQGDILPTPHPIPAEIQKSLDWIAAHPQTENKQQK
ncbi:hypothetical protein JTB14_014547 [Gonioctena quinquepunctata]|nr:hypothetical protein JTB14_014547 [Gonioctena quinquepunctata]